MLRLRCTPNGLCWDKSRHFDPYALMEQEIKELAKRNINIGMQTQKCIVIFEKKKYWCCESGN